MWNDFNAFSCCGKFFFEDLYNVDSIKLIMLWNIQAELGREVLFMESQREKEKVEKILSDMSEKFLSYLLDNGLSGYVCIE